MGAPPSPTVLVTGAAGFLGRALVARLVRRGYEVRRAVRRAVDGECVVVGEIDGQTDWSSALSGVDVVVHCAGLAHTKSATLADHVRVNTQGSVNLMEQAAAAGVRRFVYISSAGVNGTETRGRPISVADAPQPHAPYAVSKLQAEAGIRSTAAGRVEVVVIRPPLIVGPDARGSLALLRKWIVSGLPSPFGLTRNRRDVVSLAVLCEQIEACIRHPEAAGETFLAGDGAPLSTREIMDAVGRDIGRKPSHVPVPLPLLSGLLRVAGQDGLRSQLLGDLEIDSSPIRRLVAAESQHSGPPERV